MKATDAPSGTALAARLAGVRIVLVRPSHPGNIGAAARAMKVMGLTRLDLVVPGADRLDPQAVAMASGARDVLGAAREHASLGEALAGTVFSVALTARRRELAAECLWIRDAALLAAAQAGPAEVAFVFGNETRGLSNEDLSQCTHWSQIPADAGYSSLNLAAAVQVAAYEFRMAAAGPSAPPAIPDAGVPARHEEVAGLVDHLERAGLASGFLDPARPGRLVPRLRRLFGRAGLEREEVALLRGLLSALEKQKS
ncbi:MAG: RNA methyltransferase [Rhodocyclaceae bacterium]|nr:RNA methyltransferase [Rhodocyclaceae bacterium]